MKKTGLVIIAGCMMLLLFLSLPVFSAGASNIEVQQAEILNSRQVEHTEQYSGNVVPPSTYNYNNRGWSGTLTRDMYYYDGSVTRAFYSGTVYCSGTCPTNQKLAAGQPAQD